MACECVTGEMGLSGFHLVWGGGEGCSFPYLAKLPFSKNIVEQCY